MASRTAPPRPASGQPGRPGRRWTKPSAQAAGLGRRAHRGRVCSMAMAGPPEEHRNGKSETMAGGAPPIYRRHRRRLPAPQRRRQIIDVASQLIADRGFWGVSMQDVADGCGLTVPGLLRHVESKVGLLIAVLEHRDVEDALSLRAHLGATEEEIPRDWATGSPA